jgi:hypothetical protein
MYTQTPTHIHIIYIYIYLHESMRIFMYLDSKNKIYINMHVLASHFLISQKFYLSIIWFFFLFLFLLIINKKEKH